MFLAVEKTLSEEADEAGSFASTDIIVIEPTLNICQDDSALSDFCCTASCAVHDFSASAALCWGVLFTLTSGCNTSKMLP